MAIKNIIDKDIDPFHIFKDSNNIGTNFSRSKCPSPLRALRSVPEFRVVISHGPVYCTAHTGPCSQDYRAIEDIVNCSQLKTVISDKVINTFDEEMFDINEGTESVVSFRKLQDENIRRQV